VSNSAINRKDKPIPPWWDVAVGSGTSVTFTLPRHQVGKLKLDKALGSSKVTEVRVLPT